MEVADLWVELRGITGEFTKSMDEATLASERTDSRIGSLMAGTAKMSLGFGIAAGAVAVASVKMASEFDNSMNHLRTLAGVAPSLIKPLSDGVLKLAGQVGFNPNSLADALYHVESSFASTGITAAGAMNILKIAAEGAKIGGADLVDVTNALDAAIASGIPGVQNYQQAMGALLKIVGSGDMQMQDLADAFSTGILAIGKQYGATLNDVGAALATFGDNNMRGQIAATDLRMAIMDITKQAGPGVRALESIGIKSGQLGKDMQKGGMNAALIDLREHIAKAGITTKEVGGFLEDAFTKKSSAPMAILLGQFDRLQSKYAELKKGAGSFGEAWAATTAQFKTRMDQLKAQGEAWAIQLGNLLIPYITKFAGALMGVVHWFGEHKKAAQELGTVLKDFLIGGLILAGVALAAIAIEAALAAAPFVLLAIGIGVLTKWLTGLYEHNAKFHAFVDKIVSDVKWFVRELVAGFTGNESVVDGINGWREAVYTFAMDFRIALEDVGKFVKQFIGGFTGNESVVDGLRGWQEAVYTFGLDTRMVIDWVIKAFRAIAVAVGAVVTAVNGWLQDHRAQIEHIFSNIAKTARSFADVFSSVFDLIVAVVQVTVKIAEDLWKRFGDHLLTHTVTMLKILWETFVRVFNGLLQVLRGALEVLKGILDVFVGIFTGDWHKFLNGLSEIFGGTWNIIAGTFRVVWALIVGILREVINSISTAIGAGMALISALWGLGWHMVETLFRNTWNRLTSQLAAGWHLIADLFTGGWRAVNGLCKRLHDDVTGWFKAMWDRAWKLTTQAWDSIGRFFAGLGGKIVAALGNLGGQMQDIGKNIVIGIWNGIIGMGDWLKNKLTGWASDAIPGPIKHVLGIFSPSRVMADDIGRWIPAGIAQGILDHAHLVSSAMTQVGSIATGGRGGHASLGVTAGQVGRSSTAPIGTGSGGGTVNYFNINLRVDGNVATEQDLFRAFETFMLERGARRVRTYQPYRRG